MQPVKASPPVAQRCAAPSPEFIGETQTNRVFGDSVIFGEPREYYRNIAEGTETGIPIFDAREPSVGECVIKPRAEGPTGSRRRIVVERTRSGKDIVFRDMRESGPAGHIQEHVVEGVTDAAANRRLTVDARFIKIKRRAAVWKCGGCPRIRPFEVTLRADHEGAGHLPIAAEI